MEKSPDAFRTISEVAEWLEVPTHVLRFWESRFTQIKPVKRAGGRRYYRPADMELLGGIKRLLHDDGLTIRGVQKLLREDGVRHVASLSPPLGIGDDGNDAGPPPAPKHRKQPEAQSGAKVVQLQPARGKATVNTEPDTRPGAQPGGAFVCDVPEHDPSDDDPAFTGRAPILLPALEFGGATSPCAKADRQAIAPLHQRLRALHDRLAAQPA